MHTEDYVLDFDRIRLSDLPLVGGKNASLGEMYQELVGKGINVPGGFAVTAKSYIEFLADNGLEEKIGNLLRDLDPKDTEDLQRRGLAVRTAILNASLPQKIVDQIVLRYRKMSRDGETPRDVAVRSSATAEDLPDASFAGQQDTFLNVQGETELLESIKRCFASLFTDRAISYRNDMGFDHMTIALSVAVQEMVRSDLACSGVIFTIDTETGFRDAILISSSYGLGENVVKGVVNPDEFYVFKPALRDGKRSIIKRSLGTKEIKMIYDQGRAKQTTNIPVPSTERENFSISDDDLITLAKWACVIEDHYSNVRDTPTPMDIEWAKDGQSGELFIVQARPETVESRLSKASYTTYKVQGQAETLLTGKSVGRKVGQGPVRIITSPKDLAQMQEGEVLVADMTDPDWEPSMKIAAAIVTNRGGRTCHAAIVSREMGIPAVVGTGDALSTLKDGEEVTVSCAEGETGHVYRGCLTVTKETTDIADLERPFTNIMMNVADPDRAFGLAVIPNDGVGLARLEFIINNHIGIHPLALAHYDALEDFRLKRQIDERSVGYKNKKEFFIARLAEGVATIAAAFWPRDVIVRMSDFKTNEYAGLLGGHLYEPSEDNPMIGFRGASRYYSDHYRDGFAMECAAMRRAREDMGLSNIKLMIPFCRTPDEGRKVLAEMEKHGLKRGKNDLAIYVMAEIPANIVLAEEFAELFDGFSIGSNDLTQLVLGIDRDSETLAHLFDERNDAVKLMISNLIEVSKKKRVKVGICGQAPSDYPEFASFLVRAGIDSISLNPDVVVATTRLVKEIEETLKRSGGDR